MLKYWHVKSTVKNQKKSCRGTCEYYAIYSRPCEQHQGNCKAFKPELLYAALESNICDYQQYMAFY